MEKKFLTVAPFECAWHDDLRFQEAGRGCVAFDALAHNDVTVVFRENAGSQHYHYKRDNSPHYTVIIGSHKNKKLNIEVNGKKVVDIAGIDLQCSSTFQSYWISIYDGLISIGKGRYPFQNLVFQWLDSNPNRSVQYVGLSSWDRHVGYRNVNVLPFRENHITLWKHMDFGENNSNDDAHEDLKEDFGQYKNWGLGNFLESWELSDVLFIVGREEKAVPAHKVILAASGNFNFSSSGKDFIHLEDICYPILYALLRYIYIGQTEVPESYLSSLKDLSLRFDVITLAKLCEETLECYKLNKSLCNSGKNIELSYPNVQLHSCSVFLNRLPIDIKKLSKFQATLKYTDVEIYIEGHGLVAHSHRIIMGIWSVPFTKMFTNGMSESVSSKVYLKDVYFEAFTIMLNFMYTGEVNITGNKSIDTLLLQLILLADQFGVSLLSQQCCKKLLDHVTEDSVCPILQVISSITSCKLIEETCERIFSTHFDYCTTASTDFVLLDEATFLNILQHPDLTVTSEERVLDAILIWCMQSEELVTWERMDEIMSNSTLEIVFGQRLDRLITFLSFVRFPLLPYDVLQKLEKTILSMQIPTFDGLVQEAIAFLESGLPGAEKDLKFQHRRSSYKELRYICDGDSNGVLYYAGTSYGEHGWVNPVLAKTVSISSSSPLSRFTDPKALVSRTYQGTCFAGPRVENGRNTAWWMVDVGHDHQLMCNAYTLRQDGSKAFIRNWKFQGSMDGSNWTNLRVHENDETMCKPAQFASWPIFSPNALLPFRFFRVIVTAPTTDAASPWSFCICFLELYGFFRCIIPIGMRNKRGEDGDFEQIRSKTKLGKSVQQQFTNLSISGARKF